MTISEADYKAFVNFETDSWVKLAEHYDTLAGQMTRQAVEAVLEAVALKPGAKLLDVATGPGYVAAEAQRRGAKPTGVDFSPDMIADARLRFPTLTIEQGDAESLRYADASFDTVVCAFGMLHFPRPGKALAEAYRVLRPGGRHVFTVWCGPGKNKFFGMIGDIVLKHADPKVGLPTGPSQYMLSDPNVSAALMDAASFIDTRVEEVLCTFAASSPADVLSFLRKCALRAIYIVDRQSPDVRARIEEDLLAAGAMAITEHSGKIPCPILMTSGTKRTG